jgi:hypothetical protein
MAVITNSTSYGVAFTPAVGDFAVQVSGGAATLEVKSPNAAGWGEVGEVRNTLLPVYNPVAGIQYRWKVGSNGATVVAEQ